MKDKSTNWLTSPTYEAYALPIASLAGVADHTFVYAYDGGLPPEGCDCPCYGSGIADARQNQSPSILTVNNGRDMLLISSMIHQFLIPEIRQRYNRFLDNCDIIYGVQGVCHNMTNRILAMGTLQLMPWGSVRGYIWSTIVYGFFGRTAIPYFLRMVMAMGAAGISGRGAALQDNKTQPSWVFDLSEFAEGKKQIRSLLDNVKKLGEYGEPMALLLEMELLGAGTPQNRLAALYQMFLCNGKSQDIQNDQRLRELLNTLEKFLNAVHDGRDINQEFQEMNEEFYQRLGSDYKELFLEKYEKDLILVEEALFSKE